MIVLFVITIFALLLSAFFSASETAFFSIPREKFVVLKNENAIGSKIYEILMKSNLFLVFLLLGNNFVNIVVITGLEEILNIYFPDNLFVIFAATITILLIFGEIIPKVIAVGNPVFIARIVAVPVSFVLKYFSVFFNAVNSFNLFILRANYRYLLQTPDPFVTNEEYSIAVKEAVLTKKISESAGKTITSFLDLSEDSIVHVARNRNSLKNIKENGSEIKMTADEIAFSCDDLGEVTDIFYCSFNKNIKKYPPLWFPTTKTLGDLHDYFLENDLNCVLLVDEYGDFFGAVSRFDIYKYWQAFCSTSNVSGEKLNKITADGNSDVVKFQNWFSQDLLDKHDGAKTLNGILCSMFGKIPKTGDCISDGEFVYRIVDAGKTKIKKVEIERTVI